jgi:hypothetical protein
MPLCASLHEAVSAALSDDGHDPNEPSVLHEGGLLLSNLLPAPSTHWNVPLKHVQ